MFIQSILFQIKTIMELDKSTVIKIIHFKKHKNCSLSYYTKYLRLFCKIFCNKIWHSSRSTNSNSWSRTTDRQNINETSHSVEAETATDSSTAAAWNGSTFPSGTASTFFNPVLPRLRLWLLNGRLKLLAKVQNLAVLPKPKVRHVTNRSSYLMGCPRNLMIL